ncbi:MAG: murein hydrolase activator EnvC family protein [Gemmatimonadales bacterium]
MNAEKGRISADEASGGPASALSAPRRRSQFIQFSSANIRPLSAFIRGSAVVLLLLGGLAPSLGAQTPPNAAERLKQQRDSLARIRSERATLQQKMRELQATAHDLTEERSNLERQADATARMVRALDRQLLALADEENDVTGSLVKTQDELAIKRSILRHRVREVYKRGPLYSFEALLAAQTFGELLARYKYLHLVTQRDRFLVARVESLGTQIGNQRTALVRLRGDMEASRQEKADEEKRLRALDERRGRSLAQTQQRQQQAEARLALIARDEARLTSVVAALDAERRRIEGGRGGNFTSTSTLRTADFGKLDWPVDGTILYQFGRVINPNNTTLRWNGVGIAAPVGTPVKAVSAGTVALIDPSFGTYGATVFLQHGGGDYSIYSSLSKISVAKGERITKGQVIGLVGKTDPDLDAHLHFEIRKNGPAVDPLEWLRTRR